MKRVEPSDQKSLIAIAKRSIEDAVCGDGRGRRRAAANDAVSDEAALVLSAALLEPAGAFVTLREDGELRGCIGLLRFDVPLWENVRDAAAGAALNDPRFRPVDRGELRRLDLEISVLEPPVEIRDPALFEAGRHGIVVERGLRRGLLLPQVAPEMGWGNLEMLDGVCRKAGLPPDSWRDRATRLYVFEATCFGETTDEQADEQSGAHAPTAD